MSSEEDLHRLSELVVSVMRNNRPMTVDQIVRTVQRRAGVATDPDSVRLALMSNPHRFTTVRRRFNFTPREREVVALLARGLTNRQIAGQLHLAARTAKTNVGQILSKLWRNHRWRLVEAGPADDPGNAGAPVPAWPYRPSLSGAAAADRTFRKEEPPADAIGRTA